MSDYLSVTHATFSSREQVQNPYTSSVAATIFLPKHKIGSTITFFWIDLVNSPDWNHNEDPGFRLRIPWVAFIISQNGKKKFIEYCQKGKTLLSSFESDDESIFGICQFLNLNFNLIIFLVQYISKFSMSTIPVSKKLTGIELPNILCYHKEHLVLGSEKWKKSYHIIISIKQGSD